MVEQSIKDIFKERKWSKTTEAAFFKEVYTQLDKGVEKGFGHTFVDLAYDSADFELLSNLKYNAASLASFKNYNYSEDLFKLLLDENGEIRSFSSFKEEAYKLDNKYNKIWLKTEYDNAIAQSNMASRWLEFEKDADLYPNLKYLQIDRDTKNQAHVPWDGIVLPINHPFWNTHTPPNDWGCGCDLEQTDEDEETNGISVDDMPNLKDGFNINPGKQGKVVSGDHPYFKVNNYDEVAKKSLQLYKKYKQKEYMPLLRKKFQTKTYNVADKTITITRTGLEHCLRDGHKRLSLKNDLLQNLDEVMKNLIYIGEAPDYKNRAKYTYVYYKLKGFDDMFIDVRYDIDSKQYQLYSFGDKLNYLK